MRKSDELRADVAVVGGGVAGLASAREIARRGLSVVVVEEGGRAGAGASGAAAGMLAPQAEADCADDLFHLLSASRDMYPDFAARLAEETGVDVELDTTGTLYVALSEEDEAETDRRFAWQRAAGLAVERLTAEEARRAEPQLSPRVRSALRFPRDWQVENRKLVAALAASCEKYGATLLTSTRVEGVRVAGGRVTGLDTSRGILSAGAVVLAAGSRTSQVPLRVNENGGGRARTQSHEHPRVSPVHGQILCFQQQAMNPLVRHVVYSPRGYVVPRRDGRLLAGSTSDPSLLEPLVTAGGILEIASSAVEIAPGVASLRFSEAWAGLRPLSEDGLPVVGESTEVAGLFYATGYYRNGILLAPAAGEMVADLVCGIESELAALAAAPFSPSRFPLALAAAP